MIKGIDIVNKAKSYKGKYAKHNNKFTKYFAGKYNVKKNGYYKNGYCTLFVMYVYAQLGILSWLPKKTDHTQKLYSACKSKGLIIKDPKKAKAGMPAFKKCGSTSKKSSGHTSIFWKYEDGLVWTIDGNVSGGVVVRKKKPEWYLGFGNVLKETKPATPKPSTPKADPKPTTNLQYAIYPMKTLRFSSITTGAHAKCRNGSPSDKPIDLVGADSGRDWVYAPCDLIVLRVYPSASHAVWLRSVNKVHTPSGDKYIYIMAEHMSVDGLRVNKTFKQGAKMFTENKYGNASGNHIHWSMGISDKKITNIGRGWRKNTRGAWVLYIPGVKNVEINKALYLDKTFTTSVLDNRVNFKTKPKDKPKYKVNTNGSNLLVRVAPDKGAQIVGKLEKGTIIEIDESRNADGYYYITSPLNGYISALWVKKV